MKNSLMGLAAILGSAGFAVQVEAAQTVSVQFPQFGRELYTTTGYNYNYSAGIPGHVVNNWNVASDIANRPANGAYTSTGSGLRDSDGTTTGVGYTLAYRSADTTDANSFPAAPDFWVSTGQADTFLAGAVAFGSSIYDFGNGQTTPGSVSLTVSGLDAGATYDLIAFVGKPWWAGASSGSATVGSSTRYVTTTNSLSGWQEATSETAGSPSVGNYVAFHNLTGATSQTLTLDIPQTDSNIGLSGFQLISVPEPTTIGALALGTLLLLRRRKA